ncbi:MAG: DNA-directed RNA polymerase subunit beta' [Aestuariivita sp.]|nr:DNA-directed RNA polymerase subunit beta' [Aestuariivita sp.]MCY4346028.1 DNA-directed RNA polymerase subunit beta' [Aestuariivita sp.]
MNRELTRNVASTPNTPDLFDEIRVSLASPERILSWSYGEIKKPETINYRTFKPERDGLFCARIFGPIKDYECLCGKYKRMKYRNLVCEKCGVEVTLAKVRRERMGHIELASPVAHIWFLKSLPSRIGLMLDMTLRDLERVLYFETYVVTEPGLTDLSYGQMLTEEEYIDAQDQYGADVFSANIGAEAIRDMLSAINLEDEAKQLRAELKEATGELKPKKIIKRLKVIESFIESGNRPEWMILTVIPVIPPDLRPLVPLDGGRFATSDLNDLYRRVINRNNRLKRLIELRAPDIIVRNEKRMLQESVDALFDNGRRGRVITAPNKRPLKSLSDMLKGKQGRFRQNLLGKRVDFSGRSVIVTGPELKLHQCGLPKKMALELFKPFIFSRLEAKGFSSTVKQARRLVEKERPEVWDILDEVIREHPVLLNRAPTLHRLGIQAFEPILIEGKAIQLHPLVCSAFNADFDGDQMAVHVPLSLEAQLEARVLMMSTNNVLSPANGAPIIVPSQDMILGLYYTTLERDGMCGEGKSFASIDEVQYALDSGDVHLHAKITARISQVDLEGRDIEKRYATTPGRVLLGSLLPSNAKAPFDLVNRLLCKKEVQEVIDTVHRYCGQKESVIFCDQIMALGFREALRAGISFGKDDILVPDTKWNIVQETRDQVKAFEQQYMDGLITQGEKYNKVVDAWGQCNERVTKEMMGSIAGLQTDSDGAEQEPNSVYMMAHSGARGSETQMKQLGGMRGLMAKPNGEIIETPIISNFKEGLTVLEYFNSTHGARKGLTDTALKTATSGYLTRRLVDVAQDCIVREHDCGTSGAITVEASVSDGQIKASLAERILGRVTADDIVDPATNQVIAAKGQLIDERIADEVEEVGIQSARVRSPLICEAEEGVCSMCYGRDLARGTLVNVGEAVGIIAAQSIGEPGTQLTMRTFHIGGVVQGGQQSYLEASQEGKIAFENAQILKNQSGEMLVVGRNMKLHIRDENGVNRASHKVDYGSRILMNKGRKVKRGAKLFEWDPYTLPIIAEKDGYAKFVDLATGIAVREETDEATGMMQRIVVDWRNAPKGNSLKPEVFLLDQDGEPVLNKASNPVSYPMSVDAILSLEDGQEVKAGDVIARIPREGTKTKDITQGLPRVAELFEARPPKDHAIISEIDGYVRFGRDYKNKRRIKVESANEAIAEVEYMVPKGKHIPVQEGDFVEKGDYIMDGNPAPHDILAIMGVEALAEYMINEVQEVYRKQGVKINDKHIEVIVRQMLQKWEILDSGGTTLLKGEHVDKQYFDLVNEKAKEKGEQPAMGQPILLGITKASLQTRSFISAASFQETTRVLTEASIQGKVDKLVGLKESVIVGRLIPAGTGGTTQRFRRIAQERDNVVIEARRAEAEALAALEAPIGDGEGLEANESEAADVQIA